MNKSNVPLINHVLQFLDYCEEINLSRNTRKNYAGYLNKFIIWIKKENKNNLLPHQLTNEDVQAYKLYLSSCVGKKGLILKPISQNYYLIALRALLAYFTAKDIVSLPSDKITLPRAKKDEKTIKFLDEKQIETLLSAPNTKNPAGLRDRVILEILITTGLRVSQITNLNRNQLDNISPEINQHINEYLKTRKDENKALIINYNGRKDADKRLTSRSIERITRSYGEKTLLPFSITPDILRWGRARALLDKEILIESCQNHKSVSVPYFDYTTNLQAPSLKSTLSPITWNNIEKNINKEMSWLKNEIPTMSERYKQNPLFIKCDDCILRKLSILITSGKIKATEYKSEENKNLWDGKGNNPVVNRLSRHGEEWHREMMDKIYNFFKLKSFRVILEPKTNYGRADLAVIQNPKETTYIEVGTVSLFKLWYNLSTMEDSTFLIIPSETNIIEFKK